MVVGTRRKSDEKGITRGEQRRLSDGFSEVAGRGGSWENEDFQNHSLF